MSESSEAFTQDELDLILEEANGLGPDTHHLVQLLWHFGVHPSIVPALSRDELHKRRVDGQDAWGMVYRRTKTARECPVPALDEDMVWLPDFIERTPFGSRWSVDRQLTRIQDRLEKRGYHINVCARRFRHSCAVRLGEMGFLDAQIESMIGVTPRVLRTYAKVRFEDAYRKLKKGGWASK